MSRPATPGPFITAPTEDERCYELAVTIPLRYLRAERGYTLKPWLKITANCATQEVTMSAGFRAERRAVDSDPGDC